MFRLLILTITFGTLCAMSSCGPEEPESFKTVLILYDLSASTQNGSRESYAEQSKMICEDLDAGDELICEAITDKSIREKAPIAKMVSEPPHTTTTNKFGEEKQLKEAEIKFQAGLSDAINNILSALADTTKTFPKTDIFSAAKQAETVFKVFPNDKKVLVIMSDMLEYDGKFNFEKSAPDEKKTKAILDELTKLGAMPNLQGVEIYISGADATNNTAFYGVRDFWKAFFTQAGAHLKDENYGASLLHFDE